MGLKRCYSSVAGAPGRFALSVGIASPFSEASAAQAFDQALASGVTSPLAAPAEAAASSSVLLAASLPQPHPEDLPGSIAVAVRLALGPLEQRWQASVAASGVRRQEDTSDRKVSSDPAAATLPLKDGLGAMPMEAGRSTNSVCLCVGESQSQSECVCVCVCVCV